MIFWAKLLLMLEISLMNEILNDISMLLIDANERFEVDKADEADEAEIKYLWWFLIYSWNLMLLRYLTEQRRHENALRRTFFATSFKRVCFSSRRVFSCCLKTILMIDWMIFSPRACFAIFALIASALTQAFFISFNFLLTSEKSSEKL